MSPRRPPNRREREESISLTIGLLDAKLLKRTAEIQNLSLLHLRSVLKNPKASREEKTRVALAFVPKLVAEVHAKLRPLVDEDGEGSGLDDLLTESTQMLGLTPARKATAARPAIETTATPVPSNGAG